MGTRLLSVEPSHIFSAALRDHEGQELQLPWFRYLVFICHAHRTLGGAPTSPENKPHPEASPAREGPAGPGVWLGMTHDERLRKADHIYHLVGLFRQTLYNSAPDVELAALLGQIEVCVRDFTLGLDDHTEYDSVACGDGHPCGTRPKQCRNIIMLAKTFDAMKDTQAWLTTPEEHVHAERVLQSLLLSVGELAEADDGGPGPDD